MAVSLETKLRWFDLGAQAFARAFPGEAERHWHVKSGTVYVCPICCRGFNRATVSAGILTAEHVPPESFGGRELLLTCAECNNTAGAHLDGDAHKKERVIDALLGRSTPPLRVRIEREGVAVHAHFISKNDLTTISVGKHNHPLALEVFQALGRPDSKAPYRVTFSGERYRERSAQLSWLRSAYLALFAVSGYRCCFDRGMKIVKSQILKPREKLIRVFTVTLPERRPWSDRRLFKCTEPRCCGAQIGPYVVFLPEPGDDDFYTRLDARAQTVQNETIHGESYSWPSAPSFGYHWNEEPIGPEATAASPLDGPS